MEKEILEERIKIFKNVLVDIEERIKIYKNVLDDIKKNPIESVVGRIESAIEFYKMKIEKTIKPKEEKQGGITIGMKSFSTFDEAIEFIQSIKTKEITDEVDRLKKEEKEEDEPQKFIYGFH